MTTAELRAHPEYKVCMDKIKNYRPGFEFTMYWTQIPRAKGNGLKLILKDACELGYLESVEFGLDLNGICTDQTYRRTGKAS